MIKLHPLFSFTIGILLAVSSCTPIDDASGSKDQQEKVAYAMVIHGGAGTISRDRITAEQDSAYRASLNQALTIGEEVLKNGGSSMDAVEKTIHYLENNTLFNAGKGAVFTHNGENELDASFMDGATKNAGAIGGVKHIEHPISLARKVMEESEHVMLTGDGAEQFALEIGMDTVPNSTFYTERRWNSLQSAIEKEQKSIGGLYTNPDYKYGTVGCVALDKNGNIAAGTSTGGMTNKKYNRIGDSPVIGAGTYADNATCGVSCTGHGEYFIRYAVAYDMAAMMEYGGVDVVTAGEKIINEKLVNAGGSGGLVALDRYGNVAMPFNSEGMYRGYVKPNERKVLIYGDE